jgi:hypothetical protein
VVTAVSCWRPGSTEPGDGGGASSPPYHSLAAHISILRGGLLGPARGDSGSAGDRFPIETRNYGEYWLVMIEAEPDNVRPTQRLFSVDSMISNIREMPTHK